MNKTTETFSEKNTRFFSRFQDPSVFDCGDFNLLKIVQHAVVRDIDFNTIPFFFLPTWLLSIVLFLKRIRLRVQVTLGFKKIADPKLLRDYKSRKYLLLDVPRKVKNEKGVLVSLYFENIIRHLGKQNVLFMSEQRDASNPLHDFYFPLLYKQAAIEPLTKDDEEILAQLKIAFKRIQSKTSLTYIETRRLKGAIEIFWRQYRSWRCILEKISPEKAYLISLYQKEFVILALKRKGIKSIELQHGLISSEDIFYVYPEIISSVRSKALFADEIFVYGEYWKQVLLEGAEYLSNQIKILGDYTYRNKVLSEDLKTLLENENIKEKEIILVSVQKNLEASFEEYIHWLSSDLISRNLPAIVLVKLHPNSKSEMASILRLKNVHLVDFNIEQLLMVTDYHISIYSTTLYDALLFNVKGNFSLYDKNCIDYISKFVESGVSVLLQRNENPLDLKSKVSSAPQHESIFASLNLNLLN